MTDPFAGQGEESTVETPGSFPDSAAEMANETEVEAAAPAEVDVDARIGELTNDLQRLQAEYVNYKRRVERDRDLVRENATYAALAPITEVMDTLSLIHI